MLSFWKWCQGRDRTTDTAIFKKLNVCATNHNVPHQASLLHTGLPFCDFKRCDVLQPADLNQQSYNAHPKPAKLGR